MLGQGEVRAASFGVGARVLVVGGSDVCMCRSKLKWKKFALNNRASILHTEAENRVTHYLYESLSQLPTKTTSSKARIPSGFGELVQDVPCRQHAHPLLPTT